MNKYLAIFALAIVAVCAVSANPITGDDDVASQAALSPSDQEETAGLEGKALGFSDFCISFRDYVVSDIRNTNNQQVARVFNFFFQTDDDVEGGLKKQFPTGAAGEACKTIIAYNEELMRRYHLAKNALIYRDESYENVVLGKDSCVTVGRVMHLGGICAYYMTAQEAN